ncbi:cobalamin-dependent protein [Marivita sp. GX14005]|uniref:cobalamin-dependent protein n=1 Tax=Marivita sp. GX14005 TaxID=2942276 RepID=UPI002019B995|nr:cobalamin-dependent protein [Marivita sp. GX14005]MCL3883073.1 cobalamin B12-binding domain-containing protein [Marivita sp. GX14005]
MAKTLRGNSDEKNAQLLLRAAVSEDPKAVLRLSRRMLDSGIPAEMICEQFIPDVARLLGQGWCEDDITFTTVTIGSSRLQRILREIGSGKSDDCNGPIDAPETSVLLLMSHDADHTLGVMVLASKLRRAGISVKLSIGETTAALLDTMNSTRFGAIFMSACVEGDLPALRDLVGEIRKFETPTPPIVLGGQIVTQDNHSLDVAGVDKITNDLDQALLFCDIHCKAKI